MGTSTHTLCLILSCLQLEIGYDSFIRTTDAKHEALVCQVCDRPCCWACFAFC